MREAKRLMDEHGIGEVEESAIQMASVTRELLANLAAYPQASPEAVPEQATWTDPANGGGYGQAQLTHALGLSLWLTGLRGDAAFALMKAVLDAPVEHHDAVVIRYDNGSIGTMSGGSSHLGALDNRHELEFRAIGSEGELVIDLGRDYLWLWRDDGFEAKPELEPGALLLRLRRPAEHARRPRARQGRRQLLAGRARGAHGRDPRRRLSQRRQREARGDRRVEPHRARAAGGREPGDLAQSSPSGWWASTRRASSSARCSR